MGCWCPECYEEDAAEERGAAKERARIVSDLRRCADIAEGIPLVGHAVRLALIDMSCRYENGDDRKEIT